MDLIERDALHAFIDQQLDRIASVPPPPLSETALRRLGELDPNALRALWCGAGIASQIGMPLLAEPGRFVRFWPDADGEMLSAPPAA